jgi:hypothetical protein
MANKPINPNPPFPRMKGAELTMEWVEGNESALREPIIVETSEGLGMSMPEVGFEVKDVEKMLGGDTPVEVIGESYISTTSSSISNTTHRRAHPILPPRLDPLQMVHILFHPA